MCSKGNLFIISKRRKNIFLNFISFQINFSFERVFGLKNTHISFLNTVPSRSIEASTILGFPFLGAATIRVTTLQIHLTKNINIFFIHFDMIKKLPFEHISVKLLLMAPLYVWKVKIFRWVYYSTASTIWVGTVNIISKIIFGKY